MKYFTPQQAADYLEVHRSRVNQIIAQKKIKARQIKEIIHIDGKIGETWIIEESELKQYKRARKTQT